MGGGVVECEDLGRVGCVCADAIFLCRIDTSDTISANFQSGIAVFVCIFLF